ncbi:MAG: YidC/Oxa1 family membrane protein insertase [Tenericutes bacterium]|nr:YidC/Oxa1 family membrane protein insertase [Mycoplasmatota bacterium]
MYKKIILIILMLFIFTGCSKTLVDKDKKPIKYEASYICDTCDFSCEKEENKDECLIDCIEKCEIAKENETGQTLTENILCKPTNKDVMEIYENNNVDLSKLQDCDEYKISSGEYEGLWDTIFVKPLAWLILKLGNILNNYGISLVIISILIRIVLLPVTKSTALQSENIKVAQPEIKKIEKKYEGKTDQESLMKKSQETMAIYKKYKINPMSSCLFAVIQIPLLFAFIEAINRTPAIFEGSLLGLKLGMTPLIAIQKGAWWYIIIVILLGVITYLSFKLNKGAPSNLDNQKQMNIMNTVFVVMIIFMSFSMASAISIYWISSNIFTILQNIVVKRRSEK